MSLWDNEQRLHELEWRKMLPEDYSAVTTMLREMIQDLLKQYPALRQAEALRVALWIWRSEPA